VSAGRGVSIGITNGVAYSWGLNGSGQLGDNTTINKASPVTVVGGIINWTSVNADSTSIGIANGVAYAWGLNGSGLLGDNTAINKSSPVTVVGGITTWSNISVRNHVLGISTDIKKYTQ
jgi:alpha-tubulin suppressor-like RCC1 family protein